MLKITTHTDTHSTTLQLEGRLAGPWVGELKRCWLSTVSAKTRHPLSVDLSAVTYVDAEGKELRRELAADAVEIRQRDFHAFVSG
jgi:anti-anti-sigma regulatory factor